MESNELNKNAASEEVELLQNDEVAPAQVAPKSTEPEKIVPIEQVEPSPVKLPDSLTDHVLAEDRTDGVSEEPEAKVEMPVPGLAEVAAVEVAVDANEAVEPKAKVKTKASLVVPESIEEVRVPEVSLTEIKADNIEIGALENEVVEPVNKLENIPLPVVEVADAAETTLIDQIVQVPDDSEEDDDLFSDREPDAHAIPIHDYSSYSKIQLVNTLRRILSEGTAEEIRPHAEAIKGCFYKIRNSEIQEQKSAFTAEGNDEELFEPQEDLQEAELKDLLREYKNLRAELNKKQEAVKEENYLSLIHI